MRRHRVYRHDERKNNCCKPGKKRDCETNEIYRQGRVCHASQVILKTEEGKTNTTPELKNSNGLINLVDGIIKLGILTAGLTLIGLAFSADDAHINNYTYLVPSIFGGAMTELELTKLSVIFTRIN